MLRCWNGAIAEDDQARESLRDIIRSTLRASELTSQMLIYTGKGSYSAEPMNLNKLIHELGPLIEASISKKANVKYDLQSRLPLITADSSQFTAVNHEPCDKRL